MSTEEKLRQAIEEEKEAVHDFYSDLVTKLRSEKERLSDELQVDYESARKYVSSNPESGVGIAFAGGLIAGAIITAILKK